MSNKNLKSSSKTIFDYEFFKQFDKITLNDEIILLNKGIVSTDDYFIVPKWHDYDYWKNVIKCNSCGDWL